MNVQALPTLAGKTGLRHDKAASVLYGSIAGYNVCLVPDNKNNRFDIVFSVSRGGAVVSQDAFGPLVNGCEYITDCKIQGRRVALTTKANTFSQNKCLDNAKAALDETVNYLRYNSFENCCEQCGSTDGVHGCCLSGSIHHLCPQCFAQANIYVSRKQQETRQKNENVIGGAVGALLGSLLGVLSIVILSQMGYVAALSGIVMAICTLKGYELLGGKLSSTGIIVSVIVMIVMVYIGDRANWAIEIAEAFEVGFFDAFSATHEVLDMLGVNGEYVTNLIMQYGFAALGAIPTIINNRKNSKMKATSFRLGSNG